ncbi:hypothetical protein [Flectobacillus sp. BAB-3569]|uniref:hypothetical protein n=1 Tax=Flectobacillus sp. BAB-3569 TaxID=1509483 RepID=UPI000BA40854|nr:hypothetical protein [Flectobacillus sp. BAB-3569]PAC31274.1 hypothetical protein BWI92_11250 [Flectobacillus sp. BAB-3569]
MKKLLFVAGILLASSFSFAQNAPVALPKQFVVRAPIAPIDGSFEDYKSYSVKLNINQGFKDAFQFFKLPYNEEILTQRCGLVGLKFQDSGDFKIVYTLERFELLNSGNLDYLIQTTYQNAPAYYIGLQSSLKIMDKAGKTIFTRYHIPSIKMYVTDRENKFDSFAYDIVSRDYGNLLSEFSSYYLYTPNNDYKLFTLTKGRKSKSTFNVDEFNQSTQVFPVLLDVERKNWAGMFGEAQKYWKSLAEYTDPEDEDLQKDVRFISNYNLAISSLLINKMDEFETYLPQIKKYDRTFLGMAQNYGNVQDAQKLVKYFIDANKDAMKVEPIQAEPVLSAQQSGPNAFKYYELENSSVTDEDGNTYAGNVRLFFDFPEIEDLRSRQSSSGFSQLMNQIGSEKTSVWIYMEGEKKPKRTNLKKLSTFKDSSGKQYNIGRVASGGLSLFVTNQTNNKHYAIFDELKKSEKLSLNKEYFPLTSFAFKRPTEDSYTSLPSYAGRRKTLRTYFADCPTIVENVGKGLYDKNDAETNTKLFNDYMAACGK